VLDEAVLGDSLEEVAEANDEVAVERAASTGFSIRVVDALDEIAPINMASPLCNESSSGRSSADSFLVFRKRGKLSQANAQMPQTRSRIGLGQPMPAPVNLRALLAQGKYALSLGRVPEAIVLIEAHPRVAIRLIELLWDEDPGVVQRAADVLERITARLPRKPNPTLARILANSKDALLGLLAEAKPKKLRWNLALTIGRLPLTVSDCSRAAAVFHTYLNDPSSIVKTAALQGLADLTHHDPTQLPAVLDLLRIHSRSGTPAMRARCRILLHRLESEQAKPA
jgi:hypothetical protein